MSKPVFSDLLSFRGRRNRKSYLLYILSLIAISVVLVLLAQPPSDPLAAPDSLSAQEENSAVAVMALIAIAFLIFGGISGLAVSSQRCRDFGWTGWSVLIGLIPFIGTLFYLAIIFIPGTLGDNRYGPDPLGPDPDDTQPVTPTGPAASDGNNRA